ncbi:unnamed protein product [Didymodactylos carnosus]|uniref:Uncharacterized protein n=1 Tax=Didymodactylos carnosus TaxID=1234261 RepID=A0A814FHF4_9BILA|nr:unnamed protein product [Didymodactylos carnosus]CAF3754495.1 unnamed protein product [Didymodactylos carnosus]
MYGVVGVAGQILLYATDNDPSSEYFDCVYHKSADDVTVKYCRRPGNNSENRLLHNDCFNGGISYIYLTLRRQNITVDQLLSWHSSSIRQLDHYATYLEHYSSDDDDKFICNCTDPTTFGKYCEYRLYNETTTFEQTVRKQFQLKSLYYHGYQIHGDILCYTTLSSCEYGLLCLDWRNICDGEQQCMDGKDEESCDLLEFNECEPHEYRCRNGMCIPHEYFLDGEWDCMDNTDEQNVMVKYNCFIESKSFDCDESFCSYKLWSCGDGECIYPRDRLTFQNIHLPHYGHCLSMREYNYICETSLDDSYWTLANGLCWPFKNYNDTTYDNNTTTTCLYLVKCALSGGFELKCPCAGNNCSGLILKHCPWNIQYPIKPLIRPYISLVYNNDHNWVDKHPTRIMFRGTIKCRGSQAAATNDLLFLYTLIVHDRLYDSLFCNFIATQHNNSLLAPHYDLNCWSQTTKTFNNLPYQFTDICNDTQECLSDYRINDGFSDCFYETDEINSLNSTLCTNQEQYRFKCSDDEPKCLTVFTLIDGGMNCKNNYDKYLFGEGLPLSDIQCNQRDDNGCYVLKNYIKQSWISVKNVTSPRTTGDWRLIPFHHYCDTFWNTNTTFDESSDNCREWICPKDEYQCLTGQCIPYHWVCDGTWDCPDASDEQRLFVMKNLSLHNQAIFDLQQLKVMCAEHYNNDNQPFSNHCDLLKEYPCLLLLTDVIKDPFDFSQSRPCIEIEQIGDGIIQCYGGLDERNLVNKCGDIREQIGFDFLCEKSLSCIATHLLCRKRCPDNEDQHLCFYKAYNTEIKCHGANDVLCLNGECIENARCDNYIDCPNGEDEYWCSSNDWLDMLHYRGNKRYVEYRKEKKLDLTYFPLSEVHIVRQQQHRAKIHQIKSQETDVDKYIHDSKIVFYCNRGIAIDQLNATRCFCPPTYYGSKCQYYSDRLTVVTHLQLTSKLNNFGNNVIKIIATLVFDDTEIIDYYEFNVRPLLEVDNKYVKHRFHLLYSRSERLLKHKAQRYFNRSNVIDVHPYAIQFEAFELYVNYSIRLIGVWHYTIYFDYLPSFRLSKVLNFLSVNITDPCTNNTCNNNSICQPFLNKRNYAYICSCKSGYYGNACQYYEPRCSSYCSLQSFCKPNYCSLLSGNLSFMCICPINHFGPSCHLKYDACNQIPCMNNSTCYSTHDLSSTTPYICLCTNKYYGDRCQYEKISIKIHLNIENLTSSSKNEILASVIQYYDTDNITFDFILKYQQVYSLTPSNFEYYHEQIIAPIFGILKLYQKDYQSLYYILYIQQNQTIINVTTDLRNYCPHIDTLLTTDFWITRRLNARHLGADTWAPTLGRRHLGADTWAPTLGRRHLGADTWAHVRHKHSIRVHLLKHALSNAAPYEVPEYLCVGFLETRSPENPDESIFELCKAHNWKEHVGKPIKRCFYNNTIDQCNLCLSNSLCLQDTTTQLCLCSKCYYGHLCQFSTHLLSFTLDSLLSKDPFSVQLVYFCIVIILFIVGLFNNSCSFVTFKRSKPRKFGVGNYLFIVTILNQWSLLLLLFKVVHILLSAQHAFVHQYIIHLISCKLVSYLLSVLTRSSYWLTSLVTIERLCLIIWPTITTFRKPRIAIILNIIILLIVFGMHIHELLYYTIIKQSQQCVTNYLQQSVSIYNRVNVIVHYTIPFIIQTISITFLIILTSKTRARTLASSAKPPTFVQLFKKQFHQQKELYLTPLIIVLSSLPQIIVSFSLACTPVTEISWMRYSLLITYFLSYIPQLLGFILYVLPSTAYKQEFKETTIECLYIQTVQRTVWFENYSNMLQIDSTFEVNIENYQLYVCLVQNANLKGVPVAYCLMISGNNDNLEFFYSAMSKQNGLTETPVVIVDKHLTNVDILQPYFGKARILLCVFHVLKYLKSQIHVLKIPLTD